MTIYGDTPALAAAVLNEPMSADVREFFKRTTEPVIVSDFARLEFGAVVSRAARTRRFDPAAASRALAGFDLFSAASRPMRHGRADFDLAEKLVRDFGTKLSAPDALHLASAKNAGAVLATYDVRLAEAARAGGGSGGGEVDGRGKR